jgi:Uma2 family endonuclease
MTFPLTLRGDFIQKMTDEDLARFSRENKPYKFEKEPDRTLMVQEPALFHTGEQNNEIIYQLIRWNKEYKLGRCVDCNTGFYLKDGSLRSPDAAWISNERFESLSDSDQKGFPHTCPDFIVELRSDSDSLKTLKSKMKMWIKNGCLLAWLIDTKSETVYIYTSEAESIHSTFDRVLSGEPVLPKFEFILSELK